jgi:hypothetical protein
MPRVPTYERRVTPDILPGARMAANASGESFGGAQAADMAQLGGALFRVGAAVHDWANRPEVKEAKQRAKIAEANDALNRAYAEGRSLSQELYSQSGQDSTKVLDTGTVRWNEIRAKHLSEIKDEETRQVFAAKFDSHLNDQLARLSEQQIRNTDKVEKEVQTARIAEIHQQGLVLAGDSANLESHADLLRGVAVNAGQIYKSDAPEVRAQKVREAQGLYVNDVVTSRAKAGDYDGAIKFLEKYNEQADPRTRGELMKGLTEKRDVEAKETKIHDAAQKIFNSGVPEEKQLAEARKLPAEIADQVEQKITRWNRQQEAAKRDQEQAQLRGVSDQLLPDLASGTLTYEKARDIIQKSDLPASTRASTMMEVQKQIDAQFDAKAKKEAKAKAGEIFTTLSKMPDEQLAQENLEMARLVLGDDVAPFQARANRYRQGVKDAQTEREKRVDETARAATKALEDSMKAGVKDGAIPSDEMHQRIWDADRYIRSSLQGVPPEKFDQALETARDTVLKDVVLRSPGIFRDTRETVPAASRARISKEKGYSTYDIAPEERKRLANAKAIPEDAPFDATRGEITITDPDEVKAYLLRNGFSLTTKAGAKIGMVTVNSAGEPVKYGNDKDAEELRKKQESERAIVFPLG